jgi:hypothetical protein
MGEKKVLVIDDDENDLTQMARRWNESSPLRDAVTLVPYHVGNAAAFEALLGTLHEVIDGDNTAVLIDLQLDDTWLHDTRPILTARFNDLFQDLRESGVTALPMYRKFWSGLLLIRACQKLGYTKLAIRSAFAYVNLDSLGIRRSQWFGRTADKFAEEVEPWLMDVHDLHRHRQIDWQHWRELRTSWDRQRQDEAGFPDESFNPWHMKGGGEPPHYLYETSRVWKRVMTERQRSIVGTCTDTETGAMTTWWSLPLRAAIQANASPDWERVPARGDLASAIESWQKSASRKAPLSVRLSLDINQNYLWLNIVALLDGLEAMRTECPSLSLHVHFEQVIFAPWLHRLAGVHDETNGDGALAGGLLVWVYEWPTDPAAKDKALSWKEDWLETIYQQPDVKGFHKAMNAFWRAGVSLAAYSAYRTQLVERWRTIVKALPNGRFGEVQRGRADLPWPSWRSPYVMHATNEAPDQPSVSSTQQCVSSTIPDRASHLVLFIPAAIGPHPFRPTRYHEGTWIVADPVETADRAAHVLGSHNN